MLDVLASMSTLPTKTSQNVVREQLAPQAVTDERRDKRQIGDREDGDHRNMRKTGFDARRPFEDQRKRKERQRWNQAHEEDQA